MRRTFLCIFLLVSVAMNAFPQSKIIPIAELKYGGLLGGVQNGRWIAPTKVAPGMKAETEFLLVGPNGVEEGGVSLAKKSAMEDVCPDFTRMEFELKQDHGVGIGTDSNWNPVPRMPKKIDLNAVTYKNSVAAFLRKKGIARPVVRLKEAFRIDLEGDGVDEVVLSATYYKKGLSSDAAAGDYSVILVRKAKGKIVTDHMLVGDFVLKGIEFGAPNEYHISSIADLNGDGKMEIVMNGFYYEGEFAGVWEMKNGKPVAVKEFEIGCGV